MDRRLEPMVQIESVAHGAAVLLSWLAGMFGLLMTLMGAQRAFSGPVYSFRDPPPGGVATFWHYALGGLFLFLIVVAVLRAVWRDRDRLRPLAILCAQGPTVLFGLFLIHPLLKTHASIAACVVASLVAGTLIGLGWYTAMKRWRRRLRRLVGLDT